MPRKKPGRTHTHTHNPSLEHVNMLLKIA